MRKLTGLALLLASTIVGCAQPKFEPQQREPIIKSKELYSINISLFNLSLYKTLKPILLIGGMPEEAYQEVLEIGEKNIGGVSKATFIQISYSSNPKLDQRILSTETGNNKATYYDYNSDGYIPEDPEIDLVAFDNSFYKTHFERTGKDDPEQNAIIIDLITRYKKDIDKIIK